MNISTLNYSQGVFKNHNEKTTSSSTKESSENNTTQASYKEEHLQVSKDGDSFELNYYSQKVNFNSDKQSIQDDFRSKLKNDLDLHLEDVTNQIKSTILELLDPDKKSKDVSPSSSLYRSDILYATEDPGAVAEVPEYWNADNTSQRIVDFAMSFFDVSDMDKKEYILKVRDAVVEGYEQAKDMLGVMPDGSANLFNDTYSLTMEKFDKLLEELEEEESPMNVPQQSHSTEIAYTETSMSYSQSSLNLVA